MSDVQAGENKATIRQAFDAWAAGTGGVFDLLADDATWTIVGTTPVSGTYTSRQQFMDVVISPFNARMAAPLVPTVHASRRSRVPNVRFTPTFVHEFGGGCPGA
jgi:uncharacterized protein